MGTATGSGTSVDGITARTVLVVDDHRAVAQLLALGLQTHPSYRSVVVACDPRSARQAFRDHVPDVIVLDVHLDRDPRSGLDLAEHFTSASPEVAVVLLTGDASDLDLASVARTRACALLAKGGSLEALLDAIDRARPGRLEVDPGLLRHLTVRPAGPAVDLTSREREVLELLSEGLDVQRIADVLRIRPHTCRGYVKALLHKLDAHSQLEAVASARRHGLV